MEKIHNNLTVDNLKKTEWFNQFNKYQQDEILKGLEDKLDVSVYANTEFTADQMQQIRLGLEDNVDVFWYAKKEFNWKQMSQIRLGLKANLDVSKYANPELKWGEMESFRLNLLEKEALKIIFSSEICEINKEKRNEQNI